MKIQNVPTGSKPVYIPQRDNHSMNNLLSEFINADNDGALIYIVRRHSIDVNALLPNLGKTLLGLAVESLSCNSVRALLDEKADPCLRDGFGFSPMMYLIKQDIPNEEISEKLPILKKIFHDLIESGVCLKTAGYNSMPVLEASPVKQGFFSREIKDFLGKDRNTILR